MTGPSLPESGTRLSRVDGAQKVTGRATYTADTPVEGVAHAVVVDATVGGGRITGLDDAQARALPGVLTVLSHLNAPRLTWSGGGGPGGGGGLHVFEDDRLQYHGQPVAVVVAETLQVAQHGAELVRLEYAAAAPATDFRTAPPAEQGMDYARGDAAQALAAAPVRLDATYDSARNHHNAMELHATVARWDGDRLTVWDKTQNVASVVQQLAGAFGLPPESVRCICPFVGGAFGSALRTWPHTYIAAMAAREVGRPVKVVLTRRQLYTHVGYRPSYRYRLQLGSDQAGALQAAVHDVRGESARLQPFGEDMLSLGQMLYATPAVQQAVRPVPIDANEPTWMRGPGPASAAFAVETSMDELAAQLGMDPVELRVRNEPATDPSDGTPFSTRRLVECLRTGAQEFGWATRDPRPGATRDGDWLVGTGVAVAAYHTARGQASARMTMQPDGRVLVETGTSDMGPGTYTSLTQVAADAMRLPSTAVDVRIGDSALPRTPPHGGSQTMASVGSAVQAAGDLLRTQLVQLAVADRGSPLFGAAPDQVDVDAATMVLRTDPTRTDSYRAVLDRHGQPVVADGQFTPPPRGSVQASTHAYGAIFAEVAVDATLGIMRVRRLLGVYDAGRIINPKLAESQAIGGMVGGLGAALLEETITDPRDGRIVNADIAGYLVPTNADVPDVRAVYLDGTDPQASPIGVKGLGEVVYVGVAPAILNAVCHATGRRLRRLPARPEDLL